MRARSATLCFPALFALTICSHAEPLKIAGSHIVNQVVSDAAQILKSENGLEVEISTEGGSAAGINAVGGGEAAIGMISHELTGEDRADWPGVKLTEIQIGLQVIALGVASDVWTHNVRSITAGQMQSVYEGRMKNWKDLGGPDEVITFLDWKEGLGVWEIFAEWVYGDNRKAPLSTFEKVSSHTEARTAVEFKPGAIAPLSPLFINGRNAFALGLKNAAGEIVEANLENVKSGRYPMARPLILIVNDKPVGAAKVMVDFLLGPRAQALFKKRGFYRQATVDED